jgi:hypothetical protein
MTEPPRCANCHQRIEPGTKHLYTFWGARNDCKVVEATNKAYLYESKIGGT